MNQKISIRSCLIAFFSAGFLAFGMYHVHTVAEITEGGVLGAVLLIQHWFHISPAFSSLVLNGLCYLRLAHLRQALCCLLRCSGSGLLPVLFYL